MVRKKKNEKQQLPGVSERNTTRWSTEDWEANGSAGRSKGGYISSSICPNLLECTTTKSEPKCKFWTWSNNAVSAQVHRFLTNMGRARMSTRVGAMSMSRGRRVIEIRPLSVQLCYNPQTALWKAVKRNETLKTSQVISLWFYII